MIHLQADHQHFSQIERQFARLGQRVRAEPNLGRDWRRPAGFSIDVERDRRGEQFLFRYDPHQWPELQVIDLRADLAQLLLLVRQSGRKDKFLCGFDERHLFTAAVPGAQVGSVGAAIEALKPGAVRAAQERAGLGLAERLSRRNAAFVRQGEWFFLPEPDLQVDRRLIRRNEPLTRGAGSQPHVCREAHRIGGVSVRVCSRHPAGLTDEAYVELINRDPQARFWGWTRMRRDPELYVRGEVRHRDHRTIGLSGWHRVWMNTEREAPASRHVVFLD